MEVTAVDTADRFIRYIVKYHGLPRSIISDRDVWFMSVFWEQLCSRLNIRLRPSSAFHPQTNGQTERINGTIKQLLRVAQYQDRNWLDVLDIVEMAVNNAPLVKPTSHHTTSPTVTTQPSTTTSRDSPELKNG